MFLFPSIPNSLKREYKSGIKAGFLSKNRIEWLHKCFMKEDLQTILNQYHIYITRARLIVLEIFLQHKEALTYQDFLTHPLVQFDRITIFRTLKLFGDKKIIHRIPGSDGINRYLLQEGSENIHSNFMCSVCKKNIPLKTFVAPKVKLPKGFRQQIIEIIIGGLCNHCKRNQLVVKYG
jgi:Fur family transcriptional regulator, ferric uptake regulator